MGYSEWESYSLGDVCEYSKDRIGMDKVTIKNYISTENMFPNRGGITIATTLPNANSVTAYSNGDTLISNIRPYFKKIWFASNEGGASNDVLVLKCDEDKIDKQYLYFYLSQDKFFDYVMGTSKGTKMPRGDKDAILKYNISFPNLTEQKLIVDVLSVIDKKIEINNQINENLQSISQLLFKHWFIDFEFPNEEGLPYKSSGGEMIDSELGIIPKEWEVNNMGEFLFEKKTKVKDLDNKDIPEYSTTNTGIHPRDEKFKKNLSKTTENNKVIMKDDIVFGMSREILNFGVMKEEIGSVSSAYNIFSINKQKYIPELLEMYMRILPSKFLDLIKPASREGQGLDKKYMMIKSIIIPNIHLQVKFYYIYNIIKNMAVANNNEIRTLTEIRDTILPKLMAGEIDLSKIEIN